MIPVNQPLLDGNEKRYLEQCIDTGWVSSEGPFVEQFEEAFARRVGRRFGIAVCNGSAAIEVAIAALGIQPGDEVIMPTFTIISCAAPVVRAGATPVLVDSDPVTWNMDVSQVEAKITARTRAIMAVHIYGLPTDMGPLEVLSARHGIPIIEDAAEMHGQTYRGRPCGSLGALSTFSFYPNKHLTTGEGGMLVTDDMRLAERCRSLRNLCFNPAERFVHAELGWNFRLTNLQAALGVAQLERLDEFVNRKRAMGRYYNELFHSVRSFQMPLEATDYAQNIYWVYGLVLGDEITHDAKSAMVELAGRGIGCRPFFWPMHEQPVLKGRGLFTNERYPIAERLARRGFYIPSGLALTTEQMTEVAVQLLACVSG